MNILGFKNAAVKIWFNETDGYVFIHHIIHPTSAEYRAVVEKGLQILDERKLKYMIVDTRNLAMWAISLADINWSATYVALQLEKLGIHKVAAVVSQDIFTQLASGKMLEHLTANNFKVVYFPSVKKAEKWITQKN